MAHTPGPWRVIFEEVTHRKGSPMCHDTCGKGATPLRVTYDHRPDQWGQHAQSEPICHVMQIDRVADVMGANGEHVVCFGHDYDDYGGCDVDDARLIAAAPDLFTAASELVERLDSQTDIDITDLRLAVDKARQ